MKVAVYIEGQRLDLFDDETITIKQSVNDINDLSKIFADFSQSFNVPASDRNNQIFQFYYNADIDNGFDARTRKTASIEVDTLDFKLGKMRLNGAKIENNEPVSYSITFFGNIIKIKDLIGKDKLRELSWLSNFDHAYDGNVVKTGLTDGIDFTVDGTLYEDAIIYPLISYQRQYLYNSNPSDTSSTEQLVNIAYDAVRTDGVRSSELKAAIRLSLVVQAITEQYGIVFNSPFFDSERFNNIYVNLNKTTESLANGYKLVEEESGDLGSDFGSTFEYLITVTPDAGFEDVDYRIRLTVNDQVGYENSTFIQGTQTKGTGDEIPFSQEYSVKAEIITEQNFEFSAITEFRAYLLVNSVTLFTISYDNEVISLDANIVNELPDLGVYELLTSLFKTFNLIAVADGEDILVQDLQSWYSEGQIYDVTQFIDFKTEQVDRGKIFNEVNLKFEDSEQIIWDQFNQSNGQGYGNLEFKLLDEDGQPLPDVDGEVLTVESIFENPIHERLFNIDDGTQTVVQYCPYFDRDINPISGNLFMFYSQLVSVDSNPIGFLNDGVYEPLSGSIRMPSHSYLTASSSFNLNFNAELNEYTYNLMPDTIFKRYFEDFITDVFSVKRRMYKVKGILPDYLLQNIKLNDRLIIKDRRYIINSLTSSLVDRSDSLELINDIYDSPLATDTLNTSLFRELNGLYSGDAYNYSVDYIGLSNKTVQAFDTGDGVSFLNIITKTTYSTVNNINFGLSLNNTGFNRSVGIQVIDGINNPIYYIQQKSKVVTFDVTNITLDTNKITFDNG